MSYSSDLTTEQWALLGPVFNLPGKRGPKHAPDLRRVMDAMLLVVPASTHENRASELMLEHLTQQGSPGDLSWSWWTVGSPRPLPVRLAGTTTSSCAGSGGTTSSRCSALSGTLGASGSPTAVSDAPAVLRSRSRTPPPRRPAGFRSPASRPPCVTCHGYLPSVHSHSQCDPERVVARNQVRSHDADLQDACVAASRRWLRDSPGASYVSIVAIPLVDRPVHGGQGHA
jgi:hypothetical protein